MQRSVAACTVRSNRAATLCRFSPWLTAVCNDLTPGAQADIGPTPSSVLPITRFQQLQRFRCLQAHKPAPHRCYPCPSGMSADKLALLYKQQHISSKATDMLMYGQLPGGLGHALWERHQSLRAGVMLAHTQRSKAAKQLGGQGCSTKRIPAVLGKVLSRPTTLS